MAVREVQRDGARAARDKTWRDSMNTHLKVFGNAVALGCLAAGMLLIGCATGTGGFGNVEQAKVNISISPEGAINISQGSILRGINEASAEMHRTPDGAVSASVRTV